jgi:hypothetical protein
MAALISTESFRGGAFVTSARIWPMTSPGALLDELLQQGPHVEIDACRSDLALG